MNKLKAFVLGLIAIAIVGCSGPKTVTTYEQSPKKDPNGNIRVVHLAIKSVTPVFYNYKTDEETCSEVKFLQQVTGIKEGRRIDNVYEIHWNNAEIKDYDQFGKLNSTKHVCSFWGVGVEYGNPVVVNE